MVDFECSQSTIELLPLRCCDVDLGIVSNHAIPKGLGEKNPLRNGK